MGVCECSLGTGAFSREGPRWGARCPVCPLLPLLAWCLQSTPGQPQDWISRASSSAFRCTFSENEAHSFPAPARGACLLGNGPSPDSEERGDLRSFSRTWLLGVPFLVPPWPPPPSSRFFNSKGNRLVRCPHLQAPGFRVLCVVLYHSNCLLVSLAGS